MRTYYGCVMASKTRTLYIGVTNDLVRRVYEHKQKVSPGFSARYNTKRLVYFEETSAVLSAIAREKQLKGWLRTKKIELIESMNPNWEDLSEQWLGLGDSPTRSGSRCVGTSLRSE